MKRIIIIFTVLLSTSSLFAQKQKPTAEFYGVDFSQVNVIGAIDPEDKLIEAFVAINELVQHEQAKYDVGKYLKHTITFTNIEKAIDQTKTLEGKEFKNQKLQTIDVKAIIDAYPQTESKVIVIVAKELNKSRNNGTYIALIFDGTTKEIISQKEFNGKSGGFGLRNFWAGSLYVGLKSIK